MKPVGDWVKTDKRQCFFTKHTVNFWYLLPQGVADASTAAGEKRFQTNSWTTGTDGT